MMPTQLAPVHRERELTPEGRTSLGLTAASGDIDEFEDLIEVHGRSPNKVWHRHFIMICYIRVPEPQVGLMCVSLHNSVPENQLFPPYHRKTASALPCIASGQWEK
eukprot:1145833-Pelagomonas_calceolata.AAC.7